MKDSNFLYWSVDDAKNGLCFYDNAADALKHARDIGSTIITEYEVSMWRFKKNPKIYILNCLNRDDFAERIERKVVP